MKFKVFISLLIGGVCLYFALKGVRWEEVKQSFNHVQYGPLFLVFSLMALTHYFRARRWKILLDPIHKLPLRDLFSMNAVGFLAIHAFPLRLGEVVRPLLLKKHFGIPFSSGFATIAVERILDGIVATLVLFVGVATLTTNVEGDSPLGLGVNGTLIASAVVFFPSLGFFILAVAKRELALRIVKFVTKFLPIKLAERIEGIFLNFMEGLKALPNWKSLFLLTIESILVWIFVVFAYRVAFYSFGLDLGLLPAFTVLGFVAVGIMIPAAPGFVGTFQLFVQFALSLYGVSKSTGFAFSVLIHAINLSYIALAGFVCLPLVSTKMTKLFEDAQETVEKQVV